MATIAFNGFQQEEPPKGPRVHKYRKVISTPGMAPVVSEYDLMDAYSSFGKGSNGVDNLAKDLMVDDYYTVYKQWRDSGGTGMYKPGTGSGMGAPYLSAIYNEGEQANRAMAASDNLFWSSPKNESVFKYFDERYQKERGMSPWFMFNPPTANLTTPLNNQGQPPTAQGSTSTITSSTSTTGSTSGTRTSNGKNKPKAEEPPIIWDQSLWKQSDYNMLESMMKKGDEQAWAGMVGGVPNYPEVAKWAEQRRKQAEDEEIEAVKKNFVPKKDGQGLGRPKITDEELAITDPYMALNAAASGIQFIRGAESLVREAKRKQPPDIVAPRLSTPYFENPSQVMASQARNYNDRVMNTAMRFMREQGATPSDLTGVVAQALEGEQQLAHQILAADIEARNKNREIETTVSNQQAQLDYQAKLATEQRNLTLAEASEKAKNEGWSAMTSAITGLAQSGYNRQQSERAFLYNRYNYVYQRMQTLKQMMANESNTLALPAYEAQMLQLEKEANTLDAAMKKLDKKPIETQWLGIGTKDIKK